MKKIISTKYKQQFCKAAGLGGSTRVVRRQLVAKLAAFVFIKNLSKLLLLQTFSQKHKVRLRM